MKSPVFLRLLALTTAGGMLIGCGVEGTAVDGPSLGVTLQGNVHGGQQPVSGSKIYLYAVSTGGYSAAATSLLNGSGYVTSDSSGSFSITGTYTCPANAYVYALALGGNPGLSTGTNNSDLALMNGLGLCSSLTPDTFFQVNEATTVATAYALSAFMSSETMAGTSSTNVTGLANAFGTLNELVSPLSGTALAATPTGNGAVPQAEINSLANVLAGCVNSDGTGTGCSSLMSAANVTGASGTPIDTIQAVLNIVRNPGANVGTLYTLSTPQSVFQPALASAPSDWSLSIVYTGDGIGTGYGIAVDAAGNIWASNYSPAVLVELQAGTGAPLSGSAGYPSASMYEPTGVAIDLNGNVWVASTAKTTGSPLYAASMQKFSPTGAVLSGALGFTDSCLAEPTGVAFDLHGNVWVSSSGTARLCELSSTGAALNGSAGLTGGGLQYDSMGIAFDPGGSLWVPSYSGTTSGGVESYSSAISRYSGTTVDTPSTGLTGGGLSVPSNIAIDRSGNAWVANYDTGTSNTTTGSISVFSPSGPLSPSSGYSTVKTNFVVVNGSNDIFGDKQYSNANSELIELSNSGTILSPTNGYAVPDGGFEGAIDGSGNLWMSGSGTITEAVGIAAPVLTPIAAAVYNAELGQRP